MIVVADIVLIVLALFATGAAAISDLKTREVPDWISYGLIFAALIIRGMHSVLTYDFTYVGYALVGLIAMYLFGMIMFRTKQWGGGDAKLIMGLGVVFATKPYFIEAAYMPFLLLLLINILLVGAVYGLLYGVWLAWRSRKKFVKELKNTVLQKKVVSARLIALSIAIPLFILSFTLEKNIFRLSTMTVALLIVIYPYLWIFIKSVEKVCLYKHIPPAKLTEGDWVEEDIYVKKKLIYKQKKTGIELGDIKRLIRANVKRVLVKDGIPFTPTFFLGIIISLWHGGFSVLV